LRMSATNARDQQAGVFRYGAFTPRMLP